MQAKFLGTTKYILCECEIDHIPKTKRIIDHGSHAKMLNKIRAHSHSKMVNQSYHVHIKERGDANINACYLT